MRRCRREDAAPPATEEDLAALEAIGRDADRALERLPEHQRAALKARILEEREYEEIAREQESAETAHTGMKIAGTFAFDVR